MACVKIKPKLNLFDKFRKWETSYKHQNNFRKTLSALIPFFHHKSQLVKQSGSKLLFGNTKWMLDFTMVRIMSTNFDPCFPILYNHDEPYEDRELLHYWEPRVLFMWNNRKSTKINKKSAYWLKLGCMFKKMIFFNNLEI